MVDFIWIAVQTFFTTDANANLMPSSASPDANDETAETFAQRGKLIFAIGFIAIGLWMLVQWAFNPTYWIESLMPGLTFVGF